MAAVWQNLVNPAVSQPLSTDNSDDMFGDETATASQDSEPQNLEVTEKVSWWPTPSRDTFPLIVN
jgi:hypothetical protein